MTWEQEIASLPAPVWSADVVAVLQKHKVRHLEATQAHSLLISTLDPLQFGDALSAAEIDVVLSIVPVR